MRIGLMQPYLFPYIGYFQLINAVDKFIFYDDVSYIKQGWINRNRVLVNGKDNLFTVPLMGASSNQHIRDTKINTNNFSKFTKKFLRTLQQAYNKAENFDEVYTLTQKVLESGKDSIGDLARESIKETCRYLMVDTFLEESSTKYGNNDLKSYKRVLDICRKEKGDTYINSISGKKLYDKDVFLQEGIKLNFIASKKIIYNQQTENFVPWLSIIDVMMFNSPEKIRSMLDEYELS